MHSATDPKKSQAPSPREIIRQAAFAAHEAGLSVLPVKPNGTKAPAVAEWNSYQTRPANLDQIEEWFPEIGTGPAPGLAIVAGKVSGDRVRLGLEWWDFDCHATYLAFIALAREVGLGAVVDRIEAGYCEQTPNGGRHWATRCATAGPSCKLALRPPGKTLIEIKGEGGYCIVAPSNGRVHETGRAYVLLSGGFDGIVEISPEEREALLEVARSFDETPAKESAADKQTKPSNGGGDRPGDAYNREATWESILSPLGWTPVYERNGTRYWRRPGKASGISASTNHGGADRFYCFTSSVPHFEPMTGYSKFAAYATVNHKGDFKAAARALAREGYGAQQACGVGVGGEVENEEAPPIHRTDLGNARRLIAKHGPNLRYVSSWKKWLYWDGKRWREDSEGQVYRLAKRVVHAIRREVIAADDKQAEAILRWSIASESRSRLDSMIALAWSEEGIPIEAGQLDTDPMLLNVKNGTIDLRTGELREHRREDLITKMAPVIFEKDARCPNWLATLNLIFSEDQELIKYFQQLCGLALTGDVSEQYLPILHGGGSNGKSTLVNALLDLLGPDYAMKAPPELLIGGRGRRHPTERAALYGKRLVVAIETEEGDRLDETQVKELTGSDPITARRMREDFWTFNPTHKVMLCTNHKPEVHGTDHAIWRRLKLVPFNVTISNDKADKAMPKKLRMEAPGILAWCVQGSLDWQKAGRIAAPKIVEDVTKEYRASQDVISDFIAEHLTVSEPLRAKSSQVYARYLKFSEGAPRADILSQKAFSQVLIGRGFTITRNNGSWFNGFGLRSEEVAEDWTR
jgi:putative DNA primase/helicase